MALYYPPLYNGLQKTLGSQLNQGVTSQMTLNNTTGLQNKPGVCVIDRIDSTGKEKDTSVREYVSYSGVSGSNLTGLVRGLGGSTDQDHLVGAVVEFIPDVTVFEAINSAITAEHTTSGAHTSSAVTTLKASGTEVNTGTEDAKIVTPKAIADSNVVFTTKSQTLTNKAIQKVTHPVVTLSGTTPTIDCNSGDNFEITLSGNTTFSITNASERQFFIVKVRQGSGTSYTCTWFSGITWITSGGSAPQQTTVSNGITVYGFECTGTNTYNGYLVGTN